MAFNRVLGMLLVPSNLSTVITTIPVLLVECYLQLYKFYVGPPRPLRHTRIRMICVKFLLFVLRVLKYETTSTTFAFVLA
jgi:hypothetical protein